MTDEFSHHYAGGVTNVKIVKAQNGNSLSKMWNAFPSFLPTFLHRINGIRRDLWVDKSEINRCAERIPRWRGGNRAILGEFSCVDARLAPMGAEGRVY